MNKDQLKGRVEELKGSIKEVTGKLVGDKTLEAKGIIEKNIGKVRENVGDVKQDAEDSLASIALQGPRSTQSNSSHKDH
jgi:uncharacterized protein YjbJ (UPF0337 family)